MNRARTCLFPFSASQYQELEHQVLIFKQMASGIPIPTDLLYASLHSSVSYHPPHQYGWSYSQMGRGRKIDPEPGRCRRTDGKKWRCGKEAYNESKYCERHMHRGKNRSRKPVETSVLQTSSTTALPFYSSLNRNNNTTTTTTTTTSTPSSQNHQQHPYGLYNNKQSHFSTIDHNVTSATNYMLESDPYNSFRQGAKMKVDEHPFLSETSSGTMRSSNISATPMHDSSWLLTPLTMASPASYVNHQNTYSEVTNTGTFLQLTQREDEHNNKVMHHFFDKQNERNFWHNTNNDDLSTNAAAAAASNIQLSISIPISPHDFFLTRENEK